MVNALIGALSAPVLLEGETGISAILTTTGTILTQLTSWMTSLTSWVLGDSLALMFYAIMFIMLALHVIKSLIDAA